MKKKIWANLLFTQNYRTIYTKIVIELRKIWVCDQWSRDPWSGKIYSGSRIQGSKKHWILDPNPQHCIQGSIFSRGSRYLIFKTGQDLRLAGNMHTIPVQYSRKSDGFSLIFQKELAPGFRIRIDLMRIRIRIRIQHFLYLRIPDPDPGFDDLKLNKIYSWKFNFYFLHQKLPFTYP